MVIRDITLLVFLKNGSFEKVIKLADALNKVVVLFDVNHDVIKE
jgi:hypothetical protein